MPDIPDDVMKAAVVAFNTATDAIPDEECYRIIARAIMAERERCVKVAEADGGLVPDGFGKMDFGPNTARRIATAIRKGQP